MVAPSSWVKKRPLIRAWRQAPRPCMQSSSWRCCLRCVCALSGPHISFGFFTTDANLIQVYFFRIDSKIGTINSCFGRILVDRTAQFKYCVAEDCGILRYSQKETYFCTKPNREIQKHFERKKKKKVQTDQFAAR